MSGKSSWAELVGVRGEEAAKIIKKENPYVNPVIIRPCQQAITHDYRSDRVRVIVGRHEEVELPPSIG
ncbi:serine protease inhibitor [Escherichia coli]|uniref:serine protease inhibitor n=1 Tax=Escherichia coli TaxID=562 RepID=UPI0034D76FDD